MAGCRVVKASMDTSVTNLLNYSTQYGEAATTFVAAFKAAIEAMEGDAKDALVEFFETNIEGLVTKDIPGALLYAARSAGSSRFPGRFAGALHRFLFFILLFY